MNRFPGKGNFHESNEKDCLAGCTGFCTLKRQGCLGCCGCGCGSSRRVFLASIVALMSIKINMDNELLCEFINENAKKSGAPFSAPA